MSRLWPELLYKVFHQRSEDLRDWLLAQPEAERLALFKAHHKDLQALRQACFYRPPRPGEENNDEYNYFKPRYPRIAVLYAELQTQLASLAKWLKNERVSVWLAEDPYTLFLNLDTCWALLCDARSVSQLGKRLQDAPHARHESVWQDTGQHMQRQKDAPEPWIYSISQALLLRQADWADAYISQLFEQFNQHSDGGFYVAVHEALQQRPAQTLWQGYLGKALNLEIWIYREHLASLPAAHVQALLSWVAPDRPELRHLEPLAYDEVQQFIQQMAQEPAWREYLLRLILQRLQVHERPARNLPWIKLWKSLKPTAPEAGAHESSMLTLLHSPQPNALQLALQTLKELVSSQAPLQQPAAFATALLHHLQHPVQKIAKDSLALLKLWSKRDPERASQVLSALPQHLLTPHQAVRQQLYAWLQNQPLRPAAQETLKSLWADPQLNPLERESLLKHFPHLAQATVSTADAMAQAAAPQPAHPTPTLPSAAALSNLPQPQQAWAEALRQALASGTQPKLPSLELSQTYASGPELPRLKTAEQILESFVTHASGPVSELELETLMQSVLQVPAPADLQHAERYLDPLLKLLPRLDSQQKHVDEWGHWRLPWRNGLLALLAWGWLHGGQVYAFQLPQTTQHLFAQNVNPQAPQVLSTLACLRAGLPARLSQPDALAGWIEPSSLLERLQKLPAELISAAELENALYALAPVPREAFWPQLQAASQHLPALWQQALALACAPEPVAQAVAKTWIAELQRQPPTDFLLYTVLYQTPVAFEVTAADQSLRLFCAALASRRAAPDHKPWPELDALPLGDLRCDLGIDYLQHEIDLFQELGDLDSEFAEEDDEQAEAIFENMLEQLALFQNSDQPIPPAQHKICTLAEMSGDFQQLVKQALIAPEPLSQPLSPRMLGQHQQAFQPRLEHYRSLYPYLLNLQNTPLFLPLPALPQHWSELCAWLWPHPAQAQDIFAVALVNVGEAYGHFGGLTWKEVNAIWDEYYRQRQQHPETPEPTTNWQEVLPRLEKNDLNLALLSLGQLPWISLNGALPCLVQSLTSKHREQRQVILSVLQAGLETGRLSPQQLAETLADLLRVTRQGFRYLQDVLQNLSNQDLFGEYLVLQVLETYFARLDAQVAPAVLSALLDLAYTLCQNLGRGISDPLARQALQQLAQAKKKSVSRDKARVLLDLASESQTPLAADLVRSLLQRLLEAQSR